MMTPRHLPRSRTTLRRLVVQAVVGGLFVLAAAPALAGGPIGWNIFGGRYTDTEDYFLGVGARISVASITVVPNAEYIFTDSGASYTLNADATMSVMPLALASGWIGAGLTWITVDPESGDATTETGFNLLGGVGLNAVPLKPYGQIKWVVIEGDDPFALSIGVRF